MKISLQKISTKNLATLTKRIITLSKETHSSVTANHPLLAKLEVAFAQYDAVYTKAAYSGKGKEVAQADKARDEIFASLKSFLAGYAQFRFAPNYQSAQALYEQMKVFGLNIDRLSYAEESAQMIKLIESFERPENQQHFQTLSIVDAFTTLKTKQEEFEKIFALQTNANAELRQQKSATNLRRDVEKSLRTYLDFLTAMSEIDPWKNLYADVHEVVKAARNSNLPATNKGKTELSE